MKPTESRGTSGRQLEGRAGGTASAKQREGAGKTARGTALQELMLHIVIRDGWADLALRKIKTELQIPLSFFLCFVFLQM